MTTVSVIIKAFNEEQHIAGAIESAIAALNGFSGEVILADSGSTDKTVAIASQYPVRVVQLSRRKDRSCGVGPQLGYQHSCGEYVCLIDGDMILDYDFIGAAIAFLRTHPRAGGVSGLVTDINLENLEFKRRVIRPLQSLKAGVVDCLAGGGLYRRSAIQAVGYFSDRNLHAYEELELAERLRRAGWTLHRLGRRFVDHYGHSIGSYHLLWRRLKTHYVLGIGELLRSALFRPHFRQTVRDVPELWLWLAVTVCWLCLPIVALLIDNSWTFAFVVVLLVALAIAVMSTRYRSLSVGVYSVMAWNAFSFGLVYGFLRPRIEPTKWIDSRIVHDMGKPSKNARYGETQCV